MSGLGWRARIDTIDGAVCGAGLLIAAGQVLTCAHVVNGLDTGPGGLSQRGERRACFGDGTVAGAVEATGRSRRCCPTQLESTPAGAEACDFAALDALKPRAGRRDYVLRALGFPPTLTRTATTSRREQC